MNTVLQGLALSSAILLAGCGSGGDPAGSAANESPPPSSDGVGTPDAASADPLGIERAVAAGDPRFAPRLVDGRAVLALPGSVTARFDGEGARIALAPGAPTSEIVLTSIGRGTTLREVPAARVVIAGPEVQLLRDGLSTVVEWWRALPSGLEHGMTLSERAPGTEPLVLELTITGELGARPLSDEGVELVDASGEGRGLYASLVVIDAEGASIPASMSVHEGRIRIAVEDEGARYPLMIDPLVTSHEATLTASDRGPLDMFGYAVALTTDGSRALIGALYDATTGGYDAGSARVLVRSGTTWTEEQTLLAPDGDEIDQLGSSVSITADGTRALVGASGDSIGALRTGSARVFVRSGTSWTQEQMLAPAAGGDQARFGAASAISADGTRAIVGSYWADTAGGINAGTATVFVRSGAVWTLEQTLVAAGGAADEWFGAAVALTSDGSRAIIASLYEGNGRARSFVRTGATWTEEATLQPPAAEGAERFGRSVSVSADGTRALIGAWSDTVGGQSQAGSAWVFSRTGAVWTQEASLFAAGGAAEDFFGWSVSLSADGRRALLGAYGDDTVAGAVAGSARVFERSGTTWSEQSTLLASGGAAGDSFGGSVALSGDGTRALVGADHDDTSAGSAHVFTVRSSNGSVCSSALECGSGICVDGRCCNAACGGGAVDCQACSVAAGGTADGTCTALTAPAAAATTCRASSGVCDVAETCSSASMACPGDGFVAAATTCRASAGACDVAEACTGASAACPGDGFVAAATTCRASAGACDVAEACTGASAACPGDGFMAAATTCRASAGACDVAEACTGASAACPGDGFMAAATTCRASAGACDVAEACTGASAACPGDGFVAAATTCRASAGVCDVAEACTGASAACPGDGFVAAATTCRGSAGVCDVAEACTGASAACPGDAFVPSTTTCRASGGDCDVAETCTGSTAVCPGNVFVPSTTTCRASGGDCDVAETCTGSTAVCPANVFVPSTTTCRASGGDCDVAETCTGSTAVCPANVFVPSTTTCRASGGDCDVAETCTGSTAVCPANVFVPSTTTCRASGGDCDVAETCTGSTAVCPANVFVPSTTTCRASGGDCDVAETCTGSTAVCPSDVFVPSTTTCRASGGDCDVAETCTGSTAVCPSDAFAPSTDVCRAADGVCDVEETCSGTAPACPSDVLQPAGHVCAPASGECDAPDVCAGDSTTCIETFAPAGTTCGPDATDACDAPDRCEGTSATCLVEVEAAGVSCRASTVPACDPEEVCDGLATLCPDDVSTCGDDGGVSLDGGMPTGDAAVDPDAGDASLADAAASDAAPIGADAGPTEIVGGCSCRVAPSSPSPSPWLLGLVGLVFVRRRRAAR